LRRHHQEVPSSRQSFAAARRLARHQEIHGLAGILDPCHRPFGHDARLWRFRTPAIQRQNPGGAQTVLAPWKCDSPGSGDVTRSRRYWREYAIPCLSESTESPKNFPESAATGPISAARDGISWPAQVPTQLTEYGSRRTVVHVHSPGVEPLTQENAAVPLPSKPNQDRRDFQT